MKICNFIMMGGFFWRAVVSNACHGKVGWGWSAIVVFLVYLLLKRVPNLGEFHNLVVSVEDDTEIIE